MIIPVRFCSKPANTLLQTAFHYSFMEAPATEKKEVDQKTLKISRGTSVVSF